MGASVRNMGCWCSRFIRKTGGSKSYGSGPPTGYVWVCYAPCFTTGRNRKVQGLGYSCFLQCALQQQVLLITSAHIFLWRCKIFRSLFFLANFTRYLPKRKRSDCLIKLFQLHTYIKNIIFISSLHVNCAQSTIFQRCLLVIQARN